MATEEYRGPDISFVSAQVDAENRVRLAGYRAYLTEREQLDEKYNVSKFKREYEDALASGKDVEKALKKYNDAQINLSKAEFQNRQRQHNNEFAHASILMRQQLTERLASDAKAHLLRLQQLGAEAEEQSAALNAYNAALKQNSDNELRLIKKRFSLTAEEIGSLSSEYSKLQQSIEQDKSKKKQLELQISVAMEDGNTELVKTLTAEKDAIVDHLNELTKVETDTRKNAQKDKSKKKATDQIQSEIDAREEKKEDARAEIAARFGTKEGLKNEGIKALSESVKALGNKIGEGLNQINSKIESFYSLQAKMEARLQGATLDGEQIEYSRMLKNISQSIGLSGLVRQDKVVEKLQTLIDQGVAYNAESRAFLGTIAENVASTFDATNPDLLRLIRLQQADTTAARLGLEASLTRLFNKYFSDTSYLAQAFDSVSASLIDVSSMLSRDDSLAFEYNVQKWLGALSSLGLSESAATTISQGLNYLGTGNVTALNGSSTLQTLFAMSAGSSYADILTKGLNANSTNDLLRNMIMYLKSIADNTNENLVVKSAYAELLGVSVSDLSAIANITQTEIDNLHKKTLTYEQAYKETQDQLNKVVSRVHFSQMVSNSIDNALTTSATGIGGTPALYGMWKASSIIEDLVAGIPIPVVTTMLGGVDLKTSVAGLLKTGIAGGSLLGQLMGSLVNGRAGGAMNLDSWKIQSYTSRGQGRKVLDIGAMTGVSQSGSFDFAGSSSGSDISNSSMAGAAEDAEETSKITNKSQEGETDFIEKIYKAIGEDKSSNIIDLLGSIDKEVKSISSSSSGPILSRLVSASSFATDLSSIQATYFSTVGSNISNNNQAGLGVVVNGLSEDTKNYINTTIRTIVEAILTGETSIDGYENSASFVTALTDALSSLTLPVRVTNDYFDENQQQQAFGGIS